MLHTLCILVYKDHSLRPFCPLCLWGFRGDRSALDSQLEARSWKSIIRLLPGINSCLQILVRGWDSEIFPFTHYHGHGCCHCPSLVYAAISRSTLAGVLAPSPSNPSSAMFPEPLLQALWNGKICGGGDPHNLFISVLCPVCGFPGWSESAEKSGRLLWWGAVATFICESKDTIGNVARNYADPAKWRERSIFSLTMGNCLGPQC